MAAGREAGNGPFLQQSMQEDLERLPEAAFHQGWRKSGWRTALGIRTP